MQAFPLKGEKGNYVYFPNEKDTVINANRFAISYLGINIDTKDKVVCKLINSDVAKISSEKLDLFIRASKLLNHDNISQALEVIVDGKNLIVIYELIDGHSLKSLIYNKNLQKINFDSFFIKVIIQALVGLEFLHTNKLCHCNINPENIQIINYYNGQPDFDNPVVKIVDYDLIKLIGSDMPANWFQTKEASIMYTSPEQLLKQDSIVDERSDIYSMGLVLYEAVSKSHVYADETNKMLIHRLQYAEPLENKHNLEDYMFSIIKKACTKARFLKSIRHYSEDEKKAVLKIGINERFTSAKEFGLTLIKYMEYNNQK